MRYDSLGMALITCCLVCCLWAVVLVVWLFDIAFACLAAVCFWCCCYACFWFQRWLLLCLWLGCDCGMVYCCQLRLLVLVFRFCGCWLVFTFGWFGLLMVLCLQILLFSFGFVVFCFT